MKTLFSTLLLVAFSASVVNAQVLEETRLMNTGSNPALTIVIPGADPKMVEAEWREYLKSYGKVVRVKQSKEWVASGIQILDIGGVNKINIYSLAEEVGDGTKMVVWMDAGTGFISSQAYPKEYVASVKFLKDFNQQVKSTVITNELKEQEKMLDKAESTLTKLKRENDLYHKVIEDSKKRIAQAEKDIEDNLKAQELAQKEIEAQKDAVGDVRKKLDECKNQ